MQVWVDAQLPPSLASELRARCALDARHVLELGLHGASDERIFAAARAAAAVIVTKDVDFVRLLDRHGPPPAILWITVGNVRNRELVRLVEAAWPRVAGHFAGGEPLVEISRR